MRQPQQTTKRGHEELLIEEGLEKNRALSNLTGWQKFSFCFFSSFTTSIPNILNDPNHILAVIISLAIKLE